MSTRLTLRVRYDAILENTNPIAYFARYPGGYRQCHLKDGDARGKLAPPAPAS